MKTFEYIFYVSLEGTRTFHSEWGKKCPCNYDIVKVGERKERERRGGEREKGEGEKGERMLFHQEKFSTKSIMR